MKYRLKQLLSALALIGLMMGCGGKTSPENKPSKALGNKSAKPKPENNTSKGEGNQSAKAKPENNKADLAAYLLGKRIVVEMPMPPGTPPDAPRQEVLFQLEENGAVNVGIMVSGIAVKTQIEYKKTYKVAGLKLVILRDGKEDGVIMFSSANPKKGDNIILQQTGAAATQAMSISRIEKAGALKSPPPDGPAPKGEVTPKGEQTSKEGGASDDSLAVLKKLGAKIKRNAQGEVVDVSLANESVTDEGLAHLKGLNSLKELDLGGTSISDDGLVHLKGLKKLEGLFLGGNLVSPEGIADLKKALPNCKIEKPF